MNDTPEVGIIVAGDHVLVRQGLKLVISGEPHLRWLGEAGDGVTVLAREHLAPACRW